MCGGVLQVHPCRAFPRLVGFACSHVRQSIALQASIRLQASTTFSGVTLQGSSPSSLLYSLSLARIKVRMLCGRAEHHRREERGKVWTDYVKLLSRCLLQRLEEGQVMSGRWYFKWRSKGLSVSFLLIIFACCNGWRKDRSCLGLARTVYVHRIWPYIWRIPCQKYCIYTVYIRFWPTLVMSGRWYFKWRSKGLSVKFSFCSLFLSHWCMRSSFPRLFFCMLDTSPVYVEQSVKGCCGSWRASFFPPSNNYL